MSAAKVKLKPLAWSHQATPAATEAVRELLKIKRQQHVLAQRARQLQETVIKEGGGRVDNVRAAISHQSAFRGMRLVTRKARDVLSLYHATDGRRLRFDDKDES